MSKNTTNNFSIKLKNGTQGSEDLLKIDKKKLTEEEREEKAAGHPHDGGQSDADPILARTGPHL
jgi:hypothetical protein